jgi:uncharacterized protein YkwD
VAATAKSYSARMASEGFFAHVSPDGSTPTDRVRSTVTSEMHATLYFCGENIASGFYDAVKVTNGWINSAGHRKNMLYPTYVYLGVGRSGKVWTQDFFTLR